MRSSLAVAAAVVAVLAGCRVEGGRRAERGAPRNSPGSRLGPATGARVLDRRREEVAPGVARLTLSAIVRADAGRDSARRIMEALLGQELAGDTTLAAIRVLAYVPPSSGHGAGTEPLVPLAFLDWVPAAGWDGITAETAVLPHTATTTFVHDSAALRAMGRSPGSGPGATPPLPPGHPAPRRLE